MFPTIRCSFSGFQDFLYGQKFAIVLDVVACDNKRYRYAYHRSSWLVAGKADPGGYNCEVFLNWLKFIYSEKATKFFKISTSCLSYELPVKWLVEISQNFVAFSEYMNFKWNFKPQISPIFHSEYVNQVWISGVLGVNFNCAFVRFLLDKLCSSF